MLLKEEVNSTERRQSRADSTAWGADEDGERAARAS